MYVSVSIGIYMPVPWRQEEDSRSQESVVTGSCEAADVGVGKTILWSSARAVSTLIHWGLSPAHRAGILFHYRNHRQLAKDWSKSMCNKKQYCQYELRTLHCLVWTYVATDNLKLIPWPLGHILLRWRRTRSPWMCDYALSRHGAKNRIRSIRKRKRLMLFSNTL